MYCRDEGKGPPNTLQIQSYLRVVIQQVVSGGLQKGVFQQGVAMGSPLSWDWVRQLAGTGAGRAGRVDVPEENRCNLSDTIGNQKTPSRTSEKGAKKETRLAERFQHGTSKSARGTWRSNLVPGLC